MFAMLGRVVLQALDALGRNPLRSVLTLAGIVWGVASVALLLAYGSGFRQVLRGRFDAFGKSAVIAWPGTTSLQAGGERAGKFVHLEVADMKAIDEEVPLVNALSLESVRRVPLVRNNVMTVVAVRAVYPAYGTIRNEVPALGRWISEDDLLERRRVIVLGGQIRQRLFGNQDATGQEITVSGVRFTVIGTLDRKLQLSNYFSSDDESAWIPYSSAADLWDTRYASVLVFSAASPSLEKPAIAAVREVLGRRQNFNPTDERALTTFGRTEFQPIIDGITIGLQVLVSIIGAMTLGIGGVGLMNIMLVSVSERTREIGLLRALGAKKWHIRLQFLAEALVICLLGGLMGIGLAYAIAAAVGTLPLLGPVFEDDSGVGDLRLVIAPFTVVLSAVILFFVGTLSALVPAWRASRLDPADALRYE